MKLDDKFKIYYDDGPCDIYVKSVAANVIKGHHLKRRIYLQIMSIGLSDLIWRVFTTIMNLTKEKSKKLNFFVNLVLVSINCNMRLPLDKITYFDDVIIRFNCVDKIVYREKTHYFVDAYVCKKQNHVTCINKSTIIIIIVIIIIIIIIIVHYISFPSIFSPLFHLSKCFHC